MEGETKLRMVLVTPGGPGVTVRKATGLLREFKVTVIVIARGQTAGKKVWGEAVNGLAMCIELFDKKVYAGSAPKVRLSFKNVGKKTLEIYGHRWKIVPMSKEKRLIPYISRNALFFDGPRPGPDQKPRWTLKTGEESSFETQLGSHATNGMGTGNRKHFLLTKSGEYYLTASLQSSGSVVLKKGWKGLVSCSVPVSVTGIDLSTVEPGPEHKKMRFRFCPFSHTYKLNEKPIFYFEAINLSEKGVWVVLERHELCLKVIDPEGKTHSIPADRGNTLFGFSSNVKKKDSSIDTISFSGLKLNKKGTYQLCATIDVGKGRLARRDRWKGKVTSNTVTIKVKSDR
jgi:hypothetical protein